MKPSQQKTKAKNIGNGILYHGDCLRVLPTLDDDSAQLIIADPPYFQVLLEENWDNKWKNEGDYIQWCETWVKECQRILKPEGLLYIFGQPGKREHVWLHLCSHLSRIMGFHDLIVWDRIVGYNDRSDSFTPQYEMILVLKKSSDSKPFFNKDAVRIPYDAKTIQTYLKDNRYKDKESRLAHLGKGKYATNILRYPSLKGLTKEKVGHPSQKPIELIKALILSSSQEGDTVLDPFLGSGTTAYVAETLQRSWLGVECEKEFIKIIKARMKRCSEDDSFSPTPKADLRSKRSRINRLGR